jgi:hypothetical protein
MKKVTMETFELLCFENYYLPGKDEETKKKHPDYVDLSEYTFDCDRPGCGGYYKLCDDGSERCCHCGKNLKE